MISVALFPLVAEKRVLQGPCHREHIWDKHTTPEEHCQRDLIDLIRSFQFQSKHHCRVVRCRVVRLLFSYFCCRVAERTFAIPSPVVNFQLKFYFQLGKFLRKQRINDCVPIISCTGLRSFLLDQNSNRILGIQ
jgi:hypothetical protein